MDQEERRVWLCWTRRRTGGESQTAARDALSSPLTAGLLSRFRNNVLSVVMNARFYAGMPIFAPSHPDLEEEAGGSRLPIGTICIIDDQSRLEFSLAERAQLYAFL